jgi:aminoglycoside phosphotransferase (APT) family kinase protein
MRARVIGGMLRLMRTQISPEVRSAAARDNAEHIERSLTLMLVEAEWPSELTARYARLAGLPEPDAALAPFDALSGLRAAAATRGEAALAAEAWLQKQIAERRDAAGLADDAPQDAGLTEQEVQAALGPYLRIRLGDPAIEIVAAKPIPGGRSKQTFRLRVVGAPEAFRECVLRVDRKAALVQTRAIDEFDLLHALWDIGGVPVPEPLLGEADPSILGGSFIVVALAEGEKAGEYFPEVYGLPAHPERVCRDLARILGRLHGVPLDKLPAGLRRSGGPADFEAQIDADYQRVKGAGLRAAEFEVAYAWLKANLPLSTAPARLCHGDMGLHNILVADGRVTALLDWELAVAGPAAFDLASLRHLVEPVMAWDAFAQAYQEAGGPPEGVEPRHLDFHTVLRRFRTNIASHSAAAMFRDGISDDFVLANAGYDMAVRTRNGLVEIMSQVAADLGTARAP